jgi:hypothetical protein
VFVHIAAVERSGLAGLNEGDQVNYELEEDRRSGKTSAGNLRVTGQGAVPAGGGAGAVARARRVASMLRVAAATTPRVAAATAAAAAAAAVAAKPARAS